MNEKYQLHELLQFINAIEKNLMLGIPLSSDEEYILNDLINQFFDSRLLVGMQKRSRKLNR